MADIKYDIDISDVVRARKEIRRWSKTNTDSIDVVNSRMKAMGNTSEIAFNQYGRAASRAQQKSKRFASVGLQQVGYQVQDFAVQVQSGTNAFVAFGQQGSQLAGILGPGGAVLGAFIAIGTALANVIYQTRKTGEELQSLGEIAKNLTEEIKSATDELEMFSRQIETVAELEAIRKLEQLNSQISEVQSKLQAMRGQGAAGLLGMGELNSELSLLIKQRDSIQDQLDRLAEKRARLENVKAITSEIFTVSNKIDFSVAIQGATLLEARLKGAAQAAWAALQNTVESVERGRRVGRGRGTMAGPTAEEIQRNDPRAQLAYAPVFEPPKARGSGGGGGSTVDPMEEYNRARDALAGLVAQYDEGVAVAERLRDAQITVNEAVKAGVITTEQGQTAMQGYIQSLEQVDSPLKQIGQTLKDSLGDAFMSIVDGSKSAGDAFRDMARLVLKQAFELMVIKPILDGLFGGSGGGGAGILGKIFGFANGGAFMNGKVTPFADGGVVGSPTVFPMANGMGLMGEAGPEAIMPLKRGKNGKLGVEASGGQQPVVINQSFNFSANGDESVKRIIAQEAPRIANLTQKQIMDQRRRGGAMKSTFG